MIYTRHSDISAPFRARNVRFLTFFWFICFFVFQSLLCVADQKRENDSTITDIIPEKLLSSLAKIAEPSPLRLSSFKPQENVLFDSKNNRLIVLSPSLSSLSNKNQSTLSIYSVSDGRLLASMNGGENSIKNCFRMSLLSTGQILCLGSNGMAIHSLNISSGNASIQTTPIATIDKGSSSVDLTKRVFPETTNFDYLFTQAIASPNDQLIAFSGSSNTYLYNSQKSLLTEIEDLQAEILLGFYDDAQFTYKNEKGVLCKYDIAAKKSNCIHATSGATQIQVNANLAVVIFQNKVNLYKLSTLELLKDFSLEESDMHSAKIVQFSSTKPDLFVIGTSTNLYVITIKSTSYQYTRIPLPYRILDYNSIAFTQEGDSILLSTHTVGYRSAEFYETMLVNLASHRFFNFPAPQKSVGFKNFPCLFSPSGDSALLLIRGNLSFHAAGILKNVKDLFLKE